MAGGIVGMDHDDRTGTRGERGFKRMKSNLPAVVVDERIANKAYILNIGEEIEKRITRSGNQNFIAGIAQNAQDERIGFARACSKQHNGRSILLAAVRIVADNRLTGGNQPLWLRLV